MVFKSKLVDVIDVTALELETLGTGYNKLQVHQDYAIDNDDACLFINITKMLKCGEQYHLKIKGLQHDLSAVEWLVLFTPKGLFKYLT